MLLTLDAPSTEDQLQRQTARILQTPGVLREGVIAHHSPNGSPQRGWAGKQKGFGTVPGWPDWELVRPFEFGDPAPPACVDFIELKSKRGSLSKAQRALHENLRAVGARVEVCRSVGEMLDTLRRWDLLSDRVEW